MATQNLGWVVICDDCNETATSLDLRTGASTHATAAAAIEEAVGRGWTSRREGARPKWRRVERCPACSAKAGLIIDAAPDNAPITELIARSSLGDAEATAVRAGADPEVVARILARSEELERAKPSDGPRDDKPSPNDPRWAELQAALDKVKAEHKIITMPPDLNSAERAAMELIPAPDFTDGMPGRVKP